MKALVTGGSAGLGESLSKALIADGFSVVNVDCNQPSEPTDALYLPCDLADRINVDLLIDTLKSKAPFDVVIFNAGISATGKFEQIAAAGHSRVMAVNAEAPMVLCAALMKENMINENGHIAFVSSLSHFTGYPGAASYAASKDALTIYANSVRKKWRKKSGIKITTIFPGPLKTDHAERHAPQGANAETRMTPESAATLILHDIKKGKANALPGTGTKLFAILGKLAPKPITWIMQKIIYNKLDKTVTD